MILHGIEYQRPTSLNMRILADHVTYSTLAFMKSIFHFCLGCYCEGYSQNGRSNLSSFFWIENIPQDINCDTRDVLVQYIDYVIKTDIPDESDVELCQSVKRLQTHSIVTVNI